MGWSKINKIHNLTSISAKTGKDSKVLSFNEQRTLAFEKCYEELADTFLKLLHESTWTLYGKYNQIDKYVLSTIDFDEIYDDIKLVITSLELLKVMIIND